MTVLRIGIASYDEMKARTLAIARGELKTREDDPKVWFPSSESFARVLSGKNRALLREIMVTRPRSMAELAERTGRKVPNLSRTLRTMERYGLVRLTRGEGGRVIPEVPFDEVVVSMPLREPRPA